MKNNETPIGWSVCMSDDSFLDNLSDIPKKINSRKGVSGGILYCPAFGGFYDNVFAIKMPTTVIFSKVNGTLSVDLSPNLEPKAKYESFFSIEQDENGFSIQVILNNMFVSDKPYTTIETLPPILHRVRNDIIYLNGRFDCHAWQRPVHFGFRITKKVFDEMKPTDKIIFNQDEVVMYVRLNTPDNSEVKLYQLSPDDEKELMKYVNRNVNLISYVSLMDFRTIWNRVRNRRPNKFLRDLNYGSKSN